MGSSTVEQPEAERRIVELGLDDLPRVEVVIRRNKRARHVRLNVSDDGEVTASIPMRFALKRLDGIVRDRGEWLAEVIQRMDLASRATEIDLTRGDPIRLLGRWVSTNLEFGGRSRAWLEADEDELGQVRERLEIRCPAGKDPYDVLERWYRTEARSIIGDRVAHWAAELNLRTGKLSIRDQRTRWGSCSHEGDLSFNWRLILAPLWVLDAIVVHELCHIEELNHSDAFWDLVYSRYPRHDEGRDWLVEHGAALRITRPRVRTSGTPDQLPDAPPARRSIRSRSSQHQTSLF